MLYVIAIFIGTLIGLALAIEDADYEFYLQMLEFNEMEDKIAESLSEESNKGSAQEFEDDNEDLLGELLG